MTSARAAQNSRDQHKLRVCMVVHALYYRDGRVRGYAEALVQDGAEVDVLSLRQERPDPGASAQVRVRMIPLSGRYGSVLSYALGYCVSFVMFAAWLTALHLVKRYDVIHVHNMPDFLVFAALPAKLMGARVILDIHDPMPQFYMSKFGKGEGSFLQRFMVAQERASIRFADAVITANTLFRQGLIARGAPPDKVTVVENIAGARTFVRTAGGRKPHDPASLTMAYPGTLAPRYGLDIAVRALPLLREHVENVRLIMVGGWDPCLEDLFALADELGVADSVDYRKMVPPDMVPGILAEADVGIYTARPDPHMSVATPTKVLVYAHLGIPIVAPRLPILDALFVDDALSYFEPGSVEGFAACVLDLHLHPERADRMVAIMDDTFVNKRSWHDEIARYYGVLGRLVDWQARPACAEADSRSL